MAWSAKYAGRRRVHLGAGSPDLSPLLNFAPQLAAATNQTLSPSVAASPRSMLEAPPSVDASSEASTPRRLVKTPKPKNGMSPLKTPATERVKRSWTPEYVHSLDRWPRFSFVF